MIINREKDSEESRDCMQGIKENPLGAAPVPRLMLKFAIPSIIAMLVHSIILLTNCLLDKLSEH